MADVPAPHIGVDGYNLAIPRGTGVATYARNLCQCVAGLGRPPDLLYGLAVDPQASAAQQEVEFAEQLRSERGYKRPAYPTPAWARAMVQARLGLGAAEITLNERVDLRPLQAQLPSHGRILNAPHLFARATHYFRNFGRFVTVRAAEPPAIMHWTYPVPIRLAGARNIYTVHDIVPLRMPFATLDHKPTHIRLLRECLRSADHVCTVSERSRTDLLDFFPETPPERVTNTYQAVVPSPPGLTIAEGDRLLRDGFGLEPGGYFLFFGSIEPKKNVARLLQAFLSIVTALPLVLVAARAWGDEGALLRDRDPGDRRIRQIEYLPQDMLALLIRRARAVTFPSLYEGFGLPVIEAMQQGTPVLTSREGSLPEVAGEAALFVDAYDVADIAAGLRRLSDDDALCETLRARGLRHAEQFAMAPFQTRMQAVWRQVLGIHDAVQDQEVGGRARHRGGAPLDCPRQRGVRPA